MTATFILQRHVDHSGVSGTGVVAEGCEFSDGTVALRWPGEHPSTAVWPDMRDMEFIHGHEGDTVVQYRDPDRLVRAYERAVFWLLRARPTNRPVTCEEHPDHPGCLRLTFATERAWRLWISLYEGSTHAATHVEQNGETRHRWITPDGDLWLEWFAPLADDNDPLATFDREDR